VRDIPLPGASLTDGLAASRAGRVARRVTCGARRDRHDAPINVSRDQMTNHGPPRTARTRRAKVGLPAMMGPPMKLTDQTFVGTLGWVDADQ
jgi:hypothetical protein